MAENQEEPQRRPGSSVLGALGVGSLFGGSPEGVISQIPTEVVLPTPSLSLGGVAGGTIPSTTTQTIGTASPAASYSILPALGAIGAYDVLANDRGSVRGPLQGAASGAALGSYFGPVGTGIGAGIGGAAGLIRSLFGGGSKTEVEEARRKKLAESGITIPLVKDEGIDPTSVFEKTRNEADLRPQDVQGYAAFFERVPGYQNLGLDQKLELAKRALDLGLIEEHHGTIDINPSQEFDTFVKERLGA